MRSIIRIFVLAAVLVSAAAAFAQAFPSALRLAGRYFRQAAMRWNLTRPTTL